MIGLYFSGTGNTKFCIEKFLDDYDKTAPLVPLEKDNAAAFVAEACATEGATSNRSRDSWADQMAEACTAGDTTDMANSCAPRSAAAGSNAPDIVLAYPIYYSNLPKIVHDFICANPTLWHNKRIYLIATMGLFSGDGTGVAARLLKKYGACIIGGLHVKMPDCICDVKALKRTPDKNKQLVDAAVKQLTAAATQLKKGVPTTDGLGFPAHMAGLFGQRLWFCGKTRHYTDKLKIDARACIGCGKCISICPMHNLSLCGRTASSQNRCTMCYRCVNQCPQKAITLLGKRVIAQHSMAEQ